MADKVRQLIESMVWDLKGLEKRGFFDETEIKDILKTREDQEYALNKNSATALDFLKAIQFEMGLETQRKERFEELNIKRKKESDYHIIKRIILLFDRVCHKFKYNIDIWKQYLRFCVQIQSKKNFWKALSRCLKFNSEDIELWKIGAYYEFEIQRNPFKARQLFHKAIKSNGKSMDTWLAYLEFEAKFVKLVEQRDDFLKGKTSSNKEQENFLSFGKSKNEGNEEDSDFMEFESDKEEEEVMNTDSYNRSTHELLVIICESIIENFEGEVGD